MSNATKRKEKQKWAIEKPKLDNARRLRGIYFINPDDEEFKDIMKMLVESWKSRCQPQCLANFNLISTGQHACTVEADESMRKRMQGYPHKNHEDHIAGKGMSSLSHYKLVHIFIPMPQAMKTPDAKTAVEKDSEKLNNIPAWQLTKVRNKNEVIARARNEGRTVHFCVVNGSLSFLEFGVGATVFQKYQGRVVLRGDTVKDDSGSYAAFTEQGSSASQVTAAKVMAIISRLPGCAGQGSRRSISLHSGHNGRRINTVESSKVRMSRCFATSTTTQMAKIMVQYGRASRSS